MESQVIIPQKSPNDKRQYQAFTLNNGVKVLLIHDNTLQKSACSVSVGVGSLEDPSRSLGLAHFLQHMLFMGSKKYPSHNQYSSFISLNSGMDNAYTSDQQTNYFFEISNKAFPQAIQRLCNFFTGALLTQSCITKQRQAVHQQYVLWTNDDNCRKWEVISKLSQGPYSKFKIGNNQTLGHDQIRKDLVEFYQKNYSSNIINAVLCSSLSLQELKTNFIKYLQQIPNKNHPGFKYDIPYPQAKLGKLIHMQSIKDQCIMEFFWVVDHLRYKYKDHIGDYISHVLGHQGNNSLLSILKMKKYASGITAYSHDLMVQTIIGLQIKLTQQGQDAYQQVYNIVIDYVASLKALNFVYEQIKQKNQIQFQFKQKSQTYRYVCGLSSKMHTIPLPQILNHKSIFNQFNQQAINHVLSQLNPFNVLIVFSSSAEIQDSITQQYLGAKYKVQDLPIRKPSNIKFESLPPNSFIPLKTQINEAESKNIPIKIGNNIYLLKDSTFKVCKAGIRLIAHGPQNYQFIELYSQYLDHLLKSITYDAQVLNTQIQYDQGDGLIIDINGFSDTIKKLVKKIGQNLFNAHHSQQSKILFEITKADYLEQLQNFYCNQVDQIADDTKTLLFKKGRVNISDTIINIQKYQYEDFTKKAISFWQKATFQWIIVGNYDEQQAINLVNSFESNINKKQLSPIVTSGCIKLTQKQIKHQIILQSDDISTSCSIVYFQVGKYNQKLFYILQLLKNHIDQPFFNALRTEKQLAYYLATRTSQVKGILGIYFILVSSTKDPQFISQQIHKFVKQFFGKMNQDLTEQKIAQLKESIKVKYITPHNNLKKLFEFVCKEVRHRTYYFNRKDKQQVNKQLENIKKQDLLEIGQKLLEKSFEILVVSKNHQEQYKKNISQTQDFNKIKQSTVYYQDYTTDITSKLC